MGSCLSNTSKNQKMKKVIISKNLFVNVYYCLIMIYNNKVKYIKFHVNKRKY